MFPEAPAARTKRAVPCLSLPLMRGIYIRGGPLLRYRQRCSRDSWMKDSAKRHFHQGKPHIRRTFVEAQVPSRLSGGGIALVLPNEGRRGENRALFSQAVCQKLQCVASPSSQIIGAPL